MYTCIPTANPYVRYRCSILVAFNDATSSAIDATNPPKTATRRNPKRLMSAPPNNPASNGAHASITRNLVAARDFRTKQRHGGSADGAHCGSLRFRDVELVDPVGEVDRGRHERASDDAVVEEAQHARHPRVTRVETPLRFRSHFYLNLSLTSSHSHYPS